MFTADSFVLQSKDLFCYVQSLQKYSLKPDRASRQSLSRVCYNCQIFTGNKMHVSSIHMYMHAKKREREPLVPDVHEQLDTTEFSKTGQEEKNLSGKSSLVLSAKCWEVKNRWSFDPCLQPLMFAMQVILRSSSMEQTHMITLIWIQQNTPRHVLNIFRIHDCFVCVSKMLGWPDFSCTLKSFLTTQHPSPEQLFCGWRQKNPEMRLRALQWK